MLIDTLEDYEIEIINDDAPDQQQSIKFFKTYPRGTLNKNDYVVIDRSNINDYSYLCINATDGAIKVISSLCDIDSAIKRSYGHDVQLILNYDYPHLLSTGGRFEMLIPMSIKAINSLGDVINVNIRKNLKQNEVTLLRSRYKNK